MHTRILIKVATRALAILAFAAALFLVLPAAAEFNPADEAPIASQFRVDINSASSSDLQSIPGIGPALAQRIIDERNVRPFSNTQDLVRVQGIGPKTLERIRPFIRAHTPRGRS